MKDKEEKYTTPGLVRELSSEHIAAYERQVIPDGYKKIRAYLGNNRWAVRYLPEGDQLRVDEELCE